MTTLKELLMRTHKNLQILEERRAKLGGGPDLRLLNEIEDHRRAIALINEARSGQVDLGQLQETLRPLLIATNVETIQVDDLEPEISPQPFEPETILIPAGSFWMGGSPDDPAVESWELPAARIELPAYRIGLYPVTNAQYEAFVRQTGHDAPKVGWVGRRPQPARLNHPAVEISWDDAQTYCQWLSRQTGRSYRLPSEAEWEKAARGGADQRIYPWGDQWEEGRCHYDARETAPVDAYPPQTVYGGYDMAGNVREWTNTLWGGDLHEDKSDFPYPWAADAREEPATDQLYSRAYRIYRGGAYGDDKSQMRCSARDWYALDSRDRECGFRIVQETEA